MKERGYGPIEIITVDGGHAKVLLGLGNSAISLFRQNPEHDYLAVQVGHGDDERWLPIFEQYELITWMGGIALGRERERMLRLTNRVNGSFRSEYGWQPNVYVEDASTEVERENYASYLMRDLDDSHIEQLIKGEPDD